MPVAVLRFVLVNKSDSDVAGAICGSIQNFIGEDGSNGTPHINRNVFRQEAPLKGIYFESQGVDRSAEQWGTMALTTTSEGAVSHRTSWADLIWGDSLLDFWDDFSADSRLEERTSAVHAPTGSLAVSLVIPAGDVSEVTFLLTGISLIDYPGGLRSATLKRGTENSRGSEIITQKNSAMHGMWRGESLLGCRTSSKRARTSGRRSAKAIFP